MPPSVSVPHVSQCPPVSVPLSQFFPSVPPPVSAPQINAHSSQFPEVKAPQVSSLSSQFPASQGPLWSVPSQSVPPAVGSLPVSQCPPQSVLSFCSPTLHQSVFPASQSLHLTHQSPPHPSVPPTVSAPHRQCPLQVMPLPSVSASTLVSASTVGQCSPTVSPVCHPSVFPSQSPASLSPISQCPRQSVIFFLSHPPHQCLHPHPYPSVTDCIIPPLPVPFLVSPSAL